MATDVERLIAVMEVNARKYERDMARATQVTDTKLREIERNFTDANKHMEKAFDGVGFGVGKLTQALAPLGAAIAGAFSISAITQAADAFTRTQNALKVAGLEGAELAKVYADLFAIAQKQGAPIEQLSRLYGQLSQAQGDLKVSSQEILSVVDATGAALRVSGVPASQASGAILGLSQSLSGGTVRAEEFNQMLEGGLRPALQAAANQIEEAGGSVGKLRQLVADGEVSSRLFFEAIKRGAPALDDLSNRAGTTTTQALTRLRNSLERLVGEADKATGASAAVAARINEIATAADAGASAIPGLIKQFQDYAKAADNIILRGPRLLQILALAQMAANPLAFQGVQDRIPASDTTPAGFNGGRFDNPAASEAAREAARGRGFSALPAPAPRLSVNDPRFRNSDDDSSGGGGKSSAERISDYEREVIALNKRTAALRQEAETFGQSAVAISKAKVEQELLTALQKDGTIASDEQRREIARLATAFAETEARLKTMKDEQAAFNELQKFIGSSISSFFSDVVSGGKNAEQALMNLTKRLADTAFQALLLGDGPLAGFFGTKSAGGGVGGLLGLLTGGFAPGRSLGGNVRAGQAYTVGENGRETFVPSQPGRIMNARQMGGGGAITIGGAQVIVQGNADPKVAAMIAAGIRENNKTILSQVESQRRRQA
jgi:tape measure domain-containing protein